MVSPSRGELRSFVLNISLGGIGNTVLPSYSGALFVVGGSGISFALSAAQELVRSGNVSNMTVIDIVWGIRNVGEFLILSLHDILY